MSPSVLHGCWNEKNPISAQNSSFTKTFTFVLEKGIPKLVNIIIGVGDGSSTELVRGDIKEGQKVIIGLKRS